MSFDPETFFIAIRRGQRVGNAGHTEHETLFVEAARLEPMILFGRDQERGDPTIMWRTALFVGLVGVMLLPSKSHAVTACGWDYRNFCGEWGIGTRGLNNCMNRNASRLSEACVRALIAEGKVSRAEVERRRVKYGR